MKYYFGAVCVLFGAWLVYRALAHRKAVLGARERVGGVPRERPVSRQLQGFQSLRAGLAPLFVLGVLLAGIALSILWFVIDQQGLFSVVDILGFLVAIFAYAYSMFVRLRYSNLGLDLSPAD